MWADWISVRYSASSCTAHYSSTNLLPIVNWHEQKDLPIRCTTSIFAVFQFREALGHVESSLSMSFAHLTDIDTFTDRKTSTEILVPIKGKESIVGNLFYRNQSSSFLQWCQAKLWSQLHELSQDDESMFSKTRDPVFGIGFLPWAEVRFHLPTVGQYQTSAEIRLKTDWNSTRNDLDATIQQTLMTIKSSAIVSQLSKSINAKRNFSCINSGMSAFW